MRADRFRYAGHDLDRRAGVLTCRYALDGVDFTERYTLPAGDGDDAAVAEAARLVYLLAGVSYYKAGAPPLIDLGPTPLRPGDAELLRRFYVEGLGEFAWRNGLDLSGVEITGGDDAGPPASYGPGSGRPLVPFGGGIDSIVTVESLRPSFPAAALFAMSRQGDRFAAIEDAAAVTGLPVVRAGRALDPAILESARRGWLNGHVPVTGIVSAVALLVAVLGGHDAVVMSNEWSASFGTVVEGGREVNHQYSKSLAFETGLRDLLVRSYDAPPEYFSLLRPYSELWVASRFAALDGYHRVFRSCNRAFAIDPAARLDHWCGRCDKCCFIDLILAPFMPAEALDAVFDGREPLADPSLAGRFLALLGASPDLKPFECVGDVTECRAAAALAAARDDRRGNPLLARLASAAGPVAPADVERLLAPLGPTHAPERYAPTALLA
ncbi:MAG TPA: hypothetical protein VKV25_08195 [Acidimicrobiales bacterium]|nr:hypothetical protein [Acidimicrobiales bacterium]